MDFTKLKREIKKVEKENRDHRFSLTSYQTLKYAVGSALNESEKEEFWKLYEQFRELHNFLIFAEKENTKTFEYLHGELV